VLHERDAEVAALHGALTGARRGAGTVVVIGGEAGAGKSSLIRAFLDAVPDGVRVLAGACDDLLAARALAPLREAVRRVPGPLADALDGPVADVPDAAEAQLAAGPTVLVVDDLHWADDATLDVLRHLGRRIAGLPAVLVLGVRTEALTPEHPAQALLGSLAGGPVVHLDLAPLSPAAVAAMSGERDTSRLHRITGGNPFFVSECLAAGPGRLPESVAEAVGVRVAQLSPATVAAVQRLSVVPTAVDLVLAKALLGEELAALAEAEERGVVEVRTGGLEFRHELARQAVVALLPELRRRSLHADVVAALRELGATDTEQIVHHAVAAGDAETVLEFAPVAAQAAADRSSHRQALAHLEAAAVYADRLPPAERVRLLDDLAWQLYIAQRFAESVTTGRRAVALAVGLGDARTEAALSVRLSRYLLMAGEVEEAERLYDRAAALLGGAGPPAARAALAVHGAALLVLTSRIAEARPLLDAALSLAVEADLPEVQALALAYRGLVRVEAGELAAGVAEVRAALALALDRRYDEAAARVYTNLAEMLHVLDDRAALADAVAEGQRFCTERGLVQGTMLLDMQRQVLALWAGDLDAAERGLRELVGRSRTTAAFAPKVDAWLGRVLARRGDPAAAQLVRSAWDESCRQRHPMGVVYSGLALAEWAWLAGDVSAAREVADTLRPMLVSGPGWAAPRAELARILARAGLPDELSAGGGPAPAGDPYEQALDLGFSGDTDAMVRAWVELDAMGAHAPAALVRHALRDRGMTRLPRGRTPVPSASGLTRRQHDVLRLVADGATNAEIAQRLGLSVRTVDHHVSSILARLGVRTRAAAVARLRADPNLRR
jgi:DNA-binding CsgD family transcriptional regulator/tetratricopeptide (TPR) repeat protein